jgi:predicted acetyltransferase
VNQQLPIDPRSRSTLAADGLRFDLVDTSDAAVFGAWLQSSTRGFHGGQLSDELVGAIAESIASRRTSGVWDETASDPLSPVGTIDAFPSPVTVPGGRDLPAWAISMVTVAPTHRRRGIARELLESELRTAVAMGLPMAMLTVSESTIYHRFGFAPAALAADYTVNTQRARFSGTVPDGRVQLLDIEKARQLVDELYLTARLASPGEIEVWPRRWSQVFGIADEKDASKRPRAAVYEDAQGTTQGVVVYRMKEKGHNFSGHTAEVEYLLANTPDAYAALWRFLLELDLTDTVVARLRSADEPLRWLVNDFRAVTVETYDHLWLRILDVPAALNARELYAPLDLVIEVTDLQGHAAGRYHLGEVTTRVETAPALTLSVNELSAIYLGGVSATTLHRAGRITEHDAGAVSQLDAALRSPVTPWLSVWF